MTRASSKGDLASEPWSSRNCERTCEGTLLQTKKLGTYKNVMTEHIRLPDPAQAIGAYFPFVLEVKLRLRDRSHWVPY